MSDGVNPDLVRGGIAPERREDREVGRYIAELDRPAAAVDPALVAAARTGDAAARARLVEACLPLIASVARPYRSGTISQQELLQEGVVGVLRALERFDPDRGVPFWGYAAWWVRQAMQQLVAELTRPVVLSDRALRQLARLKHAHHELTREHGAEPSHAQLGERSGLAPAQVGNLLATEATPRSLDEALAPGEVGTFGDLVADPLAEGAYDDVLAAIESERLRRLLAGLSDREREVLRARFGDEGRSLREIGEQLGLSGERVRQIERRALGKLAGAAS